MLLDRQQTRQRSSLIIGTNVTTSQDKQFYIIAHTFKNKFLGSAFASRTPQY